MTTNLAPPLSQQSLLEISALLFLQNLEVDYKLKQQWDSLRTDIKNQLDPNEPDAYSQALKVLDKFLISRGYSTNTSTVLAVLNKAEYQHDLQQSQPNGESDRFVYDLFRDANLATDWMKALAEVATQGANDALEKCLEKYQYYCNIQQIRASFLRSRQQNLFYWTGIYAAGFLTFQENDELHSVPAPILMVYGNNKVSFGIDKLEENLNKLQYQQGVLTWQADEFSGVLYSGKITFNQVMIPTATDPYIGNEYFGVINFSPEHPQYGGKTASIIGRVGKIPDTQPATRSLSNPPAGTPQQTPPTVLVTIVDWLQQHISPTTAIILSVVGGLFVVGVLGKTFWEVKNYLQEKAQDDAYWQSIDNAKRIEEDPTFFENPFLKSSGEFTVTPEGSESETDPEAVEKYLKDAMGLSSESVKAMFTARLNNDGEAIANQEEVTDEKISNDDVPPSDTAKAEETSELIFQLDL